MIQPGIECIGHKPRVLAIQDSHQAGPRFAKMDELPRLGQLAKMFQTCFACSTCQSPPVEVVM